MSSEPHNPSNPDPGKVTVVLNPSTMAQTGTAKPHDQICNWLRANGVDPNQVPVDPHASMADGQLTLLSYVRGPDGRDVINPARTELMTETITVPVAVPPPPIVEVWLAPKCPTCGR